MSKPKPEKKPKPEPEGASPFQETEAEAALRRIAEAQRDEDVKRAIMAKAKGDYKAAKEDWAAARESRDQITRDQTTDLPLFPALKTPPPGPAAPQAEAPPAALASPGQPSAGEEWRAAWLSDLGLAPALVAKLGEAGLQTVGELADYTAAGKLLTDIPGIGEAKAAEIEEALVRFWEGRDKGERKSA